MFNKKMKLCMMLGLIAMATSCASKNDAIAKPKIQHRGHSDKWDYDQIRRNQEVEKAQAPTDMELDQAAEEAANNCIVMNKEQMIRSKSSGCTPVDDRAGMGAGMYCCPKED